MSEWVIVLSSSTRADLREQTHLIARYQWQAEARARERLNLNRICPPADKAWDRWSLFPAQGWPDGVTPVAHGDGSRTIRSTRFGHDMR